MIGQAIGHFSWPMVLYAVLSLTVIRMLPVFVALAGSGLSTEGKLFIGWFGPRGLASIVFAVIVVDANLPNRRADLSGRGLHGRPEHPRARGDRQSLGQCLR